MGYKSNTVDLDGDLNQFDWSSLERVTIPVSARKAHYRSLKADMNKLMSRLQRAASVKGGINVVMVAEKPSVASTLYAMLKPFDDQVTDSSLERPWVEKWKGLNAYHYHGKFKGIPAYFTIVSVYGHIYK